MNVVIIGATSHIAKGLINQFFQKEDLHLYLFSRSPDKVQQFVDSIKIDRVCKCDIYSDYDIFHSFSYDVVINCIGVETRNKNNCDFTRYFSVTEEFDNMVIEYLRNRNPDSLYISLSSGAVYGRGFLTPVEESSVNCLNVNQVVPEDYYGIARINAETKHRSYNNLRIIDLRIFSYFSRFINLSDGYFITDVMQSILNKEVLVTDSANIVRDYLNPLDLFEMIAKCTITKRLNMVFDVNSLRPVAKQDILDYFAGEYGLRYEKHDFSKNSSATGLKMNYYSTNNRACCVGYLPRFSSLETIKSEANYILSKHDGI
jgi:nucleoside-diphosphate-sugar epimerase